MIRFDPDKITVQIVRLKTVSTALGGSISIVDPTTSTAFKEEHKRIKVPMALARSFIQRHKKVTKYLKPIYTALVRYEDLVIAMERHPLGALGELEDEGLQGKRKWVPDVQKHVDDLLIPLTMYNNQRDWFFDGRYLYSLDHKDVAAVVRRGLKISSDGHFRKIHATTIDLQELQNKEKLQPADRTCIVFVATNNEFAISPPIWKDASDIGLTQRKKGGHEGDEEEDDEEVKPTSRTKEDAAIEATFMQFDQVDHTLAVNLGFALKAGKEISRLFGSEAVECLHLARLMIELHTVNLPDVPKEIKMTYDIGLNFSHAVAWLLGVQKRANTLESYLAVRALLKHLTSKGLFRRNIFDADRVFQDEMKATDVPVLSYKELSKDDTLGRMDLETILEQVRISKNVARRAAGGLSSVGTLMNEQD